MLVASGCFAAFTLAACGPSDPRPAVKVVASVGVLADAAFKIGYPRAQVVAIVGAAVDPHRFEPSPDQLDQVRDADLVLAVGLGLERRALPVLTRAREGKSGVVSIGEALDRARLLPGSEPGGFDPHIWFDPSLWAGAVEQVRDALIAADPSGRSVYEKNAAEYIAALNELHAQTRSRTSWVPKGSRVIVSSHACFAYFARAYDFEAIGLQGVGGDEHATTEVLDRAAHLIIARRLPAIFVDTSVSPKSIEDLAALVESRGHHVTISGPLYGSAIGPEGTSEGTYLGMFKHNLGHIATDLGATPPAQDRGP